MDTKHRIGSQAPARRALIIVGVQPTFYEGGALPVAGGNAVAERITAYLSSRRGGYNLVVTTQDWHIDPGEYFSSEPDFIDTWLVYDVADSAEAQLHPTLSALEVNTVVKEGQYVVAYSGFEGVGEDGRTPADILSAASIEATGIVSLAESRRVEDTAPNAIRWDHRTRVLTGLTEPVSPELGRAARTDMSAAGIELVLSH